MDKQTNFIFITTVICFTVILLSGIFSYNYYLTEDRKLMSKNVEDAISKGIDPLSVRCAYASEIDAVCVAYAYTHRIEPTTGKK